jgi:hypothetical protein
VASGEVESNTLAQSSYQSTLGGQPAFDFESSTTISGTSVLDEGSGAFSGQTLVVNAEFGLGFLTQTDRSLITTGNLQEWNIQFYLQSNNAFNGKSVWLRNETETTLFLRFSDGFGADATTTHDFQLGIPTDSEFTQISLASFTNVSHLYLNKITAIGGDPINDGFDVAIDDFDIELPAPANAAPVITSLNNDISTTTTGIYIGIDGDPIDNPVVITDADSANFDGGYILIERNPASTGLADGNLRSSMASLRFGQDSDPDYADGSPASGDRVFVNNFGDWIEIGTIDSGTLDGQSGHDMRINLNANATPTYIRTSKILQNLNYGSSSLSRISSQKDQRTQYA